MAITKKNYADISGQLIDFTVYTITENVEYLSGTPYFPPTQGIWGLNMAEKFEGQTITVSATFDRLNGSPTDPLTLSPNPTVNQNLCWAFDTFMGINLPVISGCGTSSNEIQRIGEGTVAIKFENPVDEVGFFFGGIDSDTLTDRIMIRLYVYDLSGSLLGTIEYWSFEINGFSGSIYNTTLDQLKVGIESDQTNISGIAIEWFDSGGGNIYDIKYNAICDLGQFICPNNPEIYSASSTSFPLIEDVQVSVGISFPYNEVLRNNNTSEQRIIGHEYPLRNYSISKGILKSSDLTVLRTFFHDCKGSLGEFLYNDRSDNSATKDDLILSDGAKTWGELVQDGTSGKYQVCKVYQVGDSTHYRPITTPTNLLVYDGVTPVVVSHSDGYTSTLPVPASGSYRASFTFTVPVRLESDILEDKILTKTVDGTKIYSLDELRFVEVKKNLRFYPSSVTLLDIGHEISIDLRWNAVSETKYTTEIFTKGSGQESRKQRQRLPEYFVNLQPRGAIQNKQLSYLIALWLCAKGNGYLFSMEDPASDVLYLCRFDSDTLRYQNQSVNLIYSMEGLRIKLFKDGRVTDGGAYYVKNGNNWDKTNSATDSDTLHFANCIKITTSAGCIYAFTSHDKDIVIGTDTYKASTAISPSAYSSNPSLSVNSEEFSTVFLQFDEDKLYSGLFKNATVETAVIDWYDIPLQLSDGIDYQKGVVGKVTSNGHHYSFEFLSLGASKLNQTFNPKTTSICRWVFGDTNCKYEKKTICVSVSVTRTPTPLAIPVQIPQTTDFVLENYRYGYVTLADGTRHTINFLEIFEGNLWINLFNPLLQWPEPTDIIYITEGCLRTLAACQAYNNSINFGAIPTTGNWVPGSYEYISPSISR